MTTTDQFAQFRREYSGETLDIKTVEHDPFTQFKRWFDEAVTAHVNEPNAMTIATSDQHGRPSCRVVLLKSCSSEGFTFFTNYTSRKGNEIGVNPHAALLFFWPELNRQIRICGKVVKTTAEESDNYFQSRPLRAQIAATLSPQSQVIPSREQLSEKLEAIVTGENNINPSRPEHWGGYRVIPDEFEFWQGKPDRLHDRISYRFSENVWIIERLGP